jgi:DNA-binding transcriptional ArsR family regulator
MDTQPELNSPRAVMLSIAEIADRDGVSRPAVSQRVKHLVEQYGLIVERDGRDRVAAVNVAQYDLLRERVGDPSKDQRPPQAAEPPPRIADSYEEALRKKTWYEAERKGLELAEQYGRLIPVEGIKPATDDCGAEIASIVRSLSNEVDVLAAAVARDGAHGLRVLMKNIESRLLTEIANALDTLARRDDGQSNEGREISPAG